MIDAMLIKSMRRKFPRRLLDNPPYKINLGCGWKPVKGTIGIDYKSCGQDMIWDIAGGIPFPDDSVSEVHMNHFIEHFTLVDLANVFWEIYRVCMNGALIYIHVPHDTGEQAYHPGHSTFWNETVMEGFVDGFTDKHHNRTHQFVLEWQKQKGTVLCARIRVDKKKKK